MAQITMDAEKVKEMCGSAIEYNLKMLSNCPREAMAAVLEKEFFGTFRSALRILRRIEILAEMSGNDIMWVSDSDMELLSKKLEEKPTPKTKSPPLKADVKTQSTKREYVVNVVQIEIDILNGALNPDDSLREWLTVNHGNMIVSFSDCKSLNEIIGIPRDYFEEVKDETVSSVEASEKTDSKSETDLMRH